jgi:hypothetical protein
MLQRTDAMAWMFNAVSWQSGASDCLPTETSQKLWTYFNIEKIPDWYELSQVSAIKMRRVFGLDNNVLDFCRRRVKSKCANIKHSLFHFQSFNDDKNSIKLLLGGFFFRFFRPRSSKVFRTTITGWGVVDGVVVVAAGGWGLCFVVADWSSGLDGGASMGIEVVVVAVVPRFEKAACRGGLELLRLGLGLRIPGVLVVAPQR